LTSEEGEGIDRICGGVFVPHVERIALVMREHYPKVLAANRFFEEETGIHNQLGSNNLNDALSHLGTLFEGAEDMSFTQQANEVHDFEGHLRRGMMESYEQIFRQRMGDVSTLWDKHDRVVAPLVAKGKLHGVHSEQDLERLRRRCKALLDEGRAAKRGHDWATWDTGTEALAEACQKATDLKHALDSDLAAGTQIRQHRLSLKAGVITAVITTLVALPLGYFFNELVQDDEVTVPNVVEMRGPAAAARLADAGLRAQIEPGRTDAARCAVSRSAPPAGHEVDDGSTVVLLLRCGTP
jgi:hypothetical protein